MTEAMLMREVGPSLVVLDETTKCMRSAHSLETIRKAYDVLIDVQARAGSPFSHASHHVAWMRDLLVGDGVRVRPKSELDTLLGCASVTGFVAFDDDTIAKSVDAFDPEADVLVVTAPSPLFYLDASQLGTGAHIVAPHRKLAIVWWERR
jgi:hypothetical protein